MDSLSKTFSRTRVLVVGDVILDRYWHGATQRISPEAPVPIVRVTAADERPGGAGNVALNIASLGGRAVLIGVVGHDAAGDAVSACLGKNGVDCRLVPSDGYDTIVKLRVISQHQQLIRLDFEPAAPAIESPGVLTVFTEAVERCDVVVLSDYAKGVLADAPALIASARAAGRPVIVDPKGTDFARYRGATVVTPNFNEFRVVAGACRDEAEIASRAVEIVRRNEFGALLVTRGEQGMTLFRADAEPVHYPARARDVYDVTGAGDTVCAVLAVALAADGDLVHAAALANTAAGIVVGKLGAAAVTPVELETALHGARPGRFGVLAEAELQSEVRAARLRGERIVMTNGCFDILHAGHVQYLAQARALGDRLIVAVNDDASVRRLKGDARPLNGLDQRLQVLAALAAVDWVVPFTEDTPARLIAVVGPDVLVKGGDYRPEEIAGADSVRASGGDVVVLDYVAGCSTTGLIEAAVRGAG